MAEWRVALRTRAIGALALTGLLVAAGQAWSQTPSVSGSDVRATLMRIHDAASRHNFQGTFVVSSVGTVQSAHIAHYSDGPNQYERIESLDGRARSVYRINDVVQTMWPGSRVALVEQRGQLNSFPSLLQAGDASLAEFYELRSEGVDRVAGHDVNVLMVKPKDAYRYGYRLWSDKASGLLLRVDVMADATHALETSAFSDVTIGIRPQIESVSQAMKKLDGYHVLKPVLKRTVLDSEGWTLHQAAPGFKEVSCVSRQMESGEANAELVLQTIYSDGLTYVSVFIEPFRPRRHTHAVVSVIGATETLTQRLGDWWLTVIGDVPPATLHLFADALERKK